MKKRHKTLFSELYSPYMSEGKNDSTAWYEEYKKDAEKSIIIDGKTFYKIIYRCKYNGNKNFSWMVLVYIPEDYRIGDTLVDENGNEFVIKAVEMMTFTTISEWYLTMWPLCVVGKTNDIGIYLAKKTQPNRYYDGHYIESNFTLEEIKKQLEEEKKRVEQMTEWEGI